MSCRFPAASNQRLVRAGSPLLCIPLYRRFVLRECPSHAFAGRGASPKEANQGQGCDRIRGEPIAAYHRAPFAATVAGPPGLPERVLWMIERANCP